MYSSRGSLAFQSNLMSLSAGLKSKPTSSQQEEVTSKAVCWLLAWLFFNREDGGSMFL